MKAVFVQVHKEKNSFHLLLSIYKSNLTAVQICMNQSILNFELLCVVERVSPIRFGVFDNCRNVGKDVRYR